MAKSSERGYQAAFCHLLNAMGYAVVHSTSHGPAEEGKDVITRGPDGLPTAFQLKQGNISVGDWRRIRDQIVELVELPIRHPSLGNPRRHRPVLVTTGSIHENVSTRIQGENRRWRRTHMALETWTGPQLLGMFTQRTGAFLPQPVPDFHRLLGFMIHNGQGLLDKAEFDLLLRSILPVGDGAPRRSRKAVSRAFAAAAVIVEYAMAGFDRAGNHFARIEACTMLACYMWAAALRLRLPAIAWRSTLELTETALDRFSGLLAKEAQNLTVFGQGSPFTDHFVAPYRAALLAGALSAHGLWHLLGGKSEWFAATETLREVIGRLSQKAWLPSEAFAPALFLASEYLRNSGEVCLGDALFRRLLADSVWRKQAKRQLRPLWGPYLAVEEAILRHLGKPPDPNEKEAWEEITVTAWPLILVAARRLMRQDLEQLWYAITELHFSEAVPDKPYSRLLWHFGRGTWQQKMVPRPQSWRRLKEEAAGSYSLPGPLAQAPHWLPYYLLVYPQRFNPGPVLALDEAVSAAVR